MVQRVVRTFILTALCLLSLLQPSYTAQPKLLLKVIRPAGDNPYLTILVSKDYGDIQLPYARANITITGPEGYSEIITADILGRASFDPTIALLGVKEKPEALTIRAEVNLGDAKASKTVTVSEGELELYFKQAAEALKEQGKRLAESGRMKEALELFKKAFEYDRFSERNSYNLAVAYENLGMYHLAVSFYSNYLLMAPTAQDRSSVKKKVINLSKIMRPVPAIPKKALEVLEQGNKAVEGRQYLQAIAYYEAVQSLAPWWSEPYYSSGLVYEFMAYQNNFEHYSTGAVINFNMFLEATGKDDSRVKDVKKRVEEIKDIKEGLKAPPYIQVK